MTCIKVAPVLLILLFFLPLKGAKACNFESQGNGVNVATINGGQVFTRFNRHLRGQGEELMALLGATTSPEDYEKTVREFFQRPDIVQVIEREKAETAALLELLQSQSISWVGIEATPEMEANHSLEASVAEYRQMKQQLSTVPNLPPERLSDILHLFYSSDSIALGELPPEVSNRIRTIPLETEEARVPYYQAQRLNEEIFDQLVTLAPNGISHEHIDRAEDIYYVARSENRALTQAEIDRALEGVDPSAHNALRAYFNNAGSYAEANAGREQVIAERAFAQSGDGVILMGETHRNGVQRNLEALCNGAASPAPTGTQGSDET